VNKENHNTPPEEEKSTPRKRREHPQKKKKAPSEEESSCDLPGISGQRWPSLIDGTASVNVNIVGRTGVYLTKTNKKGHQNWPKIIFSL
jgi:hypothetical protein